MHSGLTPLKSSLFTFMPTNLVPIEPVNVTILALYYADKISSSSECLQLDILSLNILKSTKYFLHYITPAYSNIYWL